MDHSHALRSAVAAAHRVVVAVQHGASAGDPTPDGATLATLGAVLGPHLSSEALDRALGETRAQLTRPDRGPEAETEATLDWADRLLDPITSNPAAATELGLLVHPSPERRGEDGPVRDDLLARAAFRQGSAAHLHGRHDEARTWWELARQTGHTGAGRALDTLDTNLAPTGRPGDPDADADAQRVVAAVLDEGDDAWDTGDLTTAAERYDHAAQLVRSLVDADPGEPRHRHQLARIHHTLGDLLTDARRPHDAVAAFDEAEAGYRTLVDVDPARAIGWLADVRLDRARAHHHGGALASALVDAEAGIVAHLDRFTGDPDDPLALDVAHALTRHAHLVATDGDPDVASAAADTAVRLYLSRAEEVNETAELQARHVPAFHRAALTAWALHAAAGRTERAADAAALVEGTGPRSVPLFGHDDPAPNQVADRPTLAAALDRADARALRATLVAPATDGTILCSTHRCPPDAAAKAAVGVGELAAEVLRADYASGLLLALEAHILFNGASRVRPPGGDPALGHLGPAWLSVLDAASQACEAAGDRALALDLARWMGAVCRHLGPRLGGDAALRERVMWALHWQASLLHASGDAAAARDVAASARSLGGHPNGGPPDHRAATADASARQPPGGNGRMDGWQVPPSVSAG